MKSRKMANRRPLAIGVALAVLSLALAIAFAGARAQPARAASQSQPTFGQPTISGIQGVGFEQDLRLDPTSSNRLYTSVPGSLSSNTSWIWHSEDGGKTFKWVVAGTAKEGKPGLGGTPMCAGGGDSELAVDTGGNLYFNDLTLANFSTYRSGDHGATFLCSNTGVPDAAVDRQWYAVDGNPTTGSVTEVAGNGAGHNIYLANDEIGPGAVTCPVSGAVNNVLAMYRSPSPLTGGAPTAGIEFGPGYKVTRPLSCDEGIMGNDEVSPVATRTGKLNPGPTTLSTAVKHVYVIHDDATFSSISVGRCFPVGWGAPLPNVSDPSGLNCDDLPVASFPGYKTGGNFPTLAIDKAGNLYAVWEQAPVNVSGQITGDTVLKYSYSTNEGTSWSTPKTIPTPGLHNNVFAWAAAGDDGRVDIAWYGTPTLADPNNSSCGTTGGGKGGPDATTNGIWSLYLTQTLNGHASSPSFSAPILAGEHYVHKGTIQTVLGGQCGNRTLGDFLQLRVGSRGEAQIAYADSNNADEPFAPHGMYVKQNGGSSVSASNPQVNGDPILLNAASDPAGDGKRETNGLSGPNITNLDILHSSMSQPSPSGCHPAGTACYRVRMTVNNLSLLPPAPDTVAVWLTQWLVPASPSCSSAAADCTNGGKNPFVYLESNGTCWSGQNAALLLGGGVTLTYPGTTQITAPGACSFTPGPFGTITIDVPIADVSLDPSVAPLSARLFSVTASTMTLNAPPESVPPNPGGFMLFTGPIGGVLFDLIDVVRAYDFVPGAEGGGGGGGGGCHEGDGNGDIKGEFSGTASFNVDADHCEENDTDSVDVKDQSAGVDFHSTQILSIAFDDVNQTMTIVGLGVDNGLPVTFTAVETDGLAPAQRVFEIDLSNGYSNVGELISGSITLQ
ncbi:MAG: hypothetical protein WBB76_13160 [Gaiellaceae bacterium]